MNLKGFKNFEGLGLEPLKPLSPATYAEAIGLFERALVLDPQSIEAQSSVAGILAGRVTEEMTTSRVADLERADALVTKALAASPRSPIAHFARGQVLRAQDRYIEAIPEYETVIAFNHNSVAAISALADCKLHVGPIEEVIPLQERALRLSPRDPLVSNMYGRIGIAYLLQSRIDEAIIWLVKARDANPALSFPHGALVAAYALKGDAEHASAELAEVRKLNNDFFRSVGRLRARYSEVPKMRALFEATYLAGLRKAGVPTEE